MNLHQYEPTPLHQLVGDHQRPACSQQATWMTSQTVPLI